MSRVIYLLRKLPGSATVGALVEHGTGGLNVGALRRAGGSWIPNVVFEHLADCAEDGCEAGCPVRALAEQASPKAPERFLVVGALQSNRRPPWM